MNSTQPHPVHPERVCPALPRLRPAIYGIWRSAAGLLFRWGSAVFVLDSASGDPTSGLAEAAEFRLLAIPVGDWDRLPADVQANPRRLLDELGVGSGATGKHDVASVSVPLRNGSGSVFENRKEWFYQTAFVWRDKGVEADPAGKKELLISGIRADVKMQDSRTGTSEAQAVFHWTPEPESTTIHGAPKELNAWLTKSIQFKGTLIATKGQPVVAGEWRSGIHPPGASTPGPWQYVLIFSVP